MGGLENDELRILQLLESREGVSERLGVNVPRKLFEFGLIQRSAAGTLALSQAGERLLFRLHCANFLRQDGARTSRDARQWLAQAGFITLSDDGESLVEITQRGRLWLASLDE